MKKVQITLDKGETLWYDSQVTKKAEHPPHRKQSQSGQHSPLFLPPGQESHGVCADALASAFFIIGGAYHSQV